MTNFIVASKDAVVDMESIASVFRDASGFHSISGQSRSVSIHLVGGSIVQVLEGDPNYERWIDFIARQQPLATNKEKRIRDAVADAYDPFINEKIVDIYALFCTIPLHDEMLLCLESDEVGGIRRKDDPSCVLVSWESAVEAVDHLHSYRASLRAGDGIS